MNLNTEHDLTNALEAYIGEIVEQKVDDKLDTELLAENIKDLDDFVDNRIDNLDITNVKGFDDAIESAVEKEVEHQVEKEVESQLQDLEVEADHISGLDSYFENAIENYQWDWGADDRFCQTVKEEVDDYLRRNLMDMVQEEVTENITLPVTSILDFDFHTRIIVDRAIKEYQQQLLQKLSPIYWCKRWYGSLRASIKSFMNGFYDR